MITKLKHIVNLSGITVKEFQGEKKYYSTGNINTEKFELVTFKNRPSRANLLVNENDILIAKMKNTNKTTIATKEMEEYIFSTGFSILSSKNINTKYLYYLLESPEFIEKKDVFSVGTTQVSINDEALKNIEINYIEDTDIQNRIATFLDKKVLEIDNIIVKTKETIEEYKKYKQAIITETVTNGLDRNSEMKDTKIDMIGDIPITWNIQKLKTFISIPVIDGPHESPQLYDSGIPYISATAIENGKINFDLMRGYISEEYCNQCDIRYKPEINDILVIKLGATTGQVAIVDTDKRFNIWVPLAAIRCNSSVNPKFIYYSFQSLGIIRQMKLMWTFGTQQTLGVKTIEQLMFAIPNKCEQDSIVKYLEIKCKELNNLIESKEKIIEELERYKKSLIYEYVTGKKEVI